MVKVVLRDLDPLALNALRFPLAAVVMWVLVRRLPDSVRPVRGDVPRLVGLGILGNVAYQACFVYGLDATLAGNASLLLATVPVWTLLLSTLRGHERPGVVVFVGAAGTVLGLVRLHRRIQPDGAALRVDAGHRVDPVDRNAHPGPHGDPGPGPHRSVVGVRAGVGWGGLRRGLLHRHRLPSLAPGGCSGWAAPGPPFTPIWSR